MSLFCGNCRKGVRGGFGILYRLERSSDGVLRYPDDDHNPPNSSICDSCMESFPENAKLFDEARAEAEKEVVVYGFAGAESPMGLFGAKMWSAIETDNDNLTILEAEAVNTHFPLAIEIINDMALHQKVRSIKDAATQPAKTVPRRKRGRR